MFSEEVYPKPNLEGTNKQNANRFPAKSADELHKEHPCFQRTYEVLGNSKHNRNRQKTVKTTAKSVNEKCMRIS